MNIEKLVLPNKETKILLHSCCAPCSCSIIDKMQSDGIEVTVFFYNPNIHPKHEYELRKTENKRFADKLGVSFIDADYDIENWFFETNGLEKEPERGARCSVCFYMRLAKTASYANSNGFKVITSSLSFSRWKNQEQVNEAGRKAVFNFPDMTYLTYDWRQNGMQNIMTIITKQEQFYRQKYCGCKYSIFHKGLDMLMPTHNYVT